MTNGICAGTVVLTLIVDKAISLTDLDRIVSDRRAGVVAPAVVHRSGRLATARQLVSSS